MTKGNEPAFSKAAFFHTVGGADGPQVGLTKREYFAALAMQGMYSNCKLEGFEGIYEQLSKQSVWAADALIEQLNNKQQ